MPPSDGIGPSEAIHEPNQNCRFLDSVLHAKSDKLFVTAGLGSARVWNVTKSESCQYY